MKPEKIASQLRVPRTFVYESVRMFKQQALKPEAPAKPKTMRKEDDPLILKYISDYFKEFGIGSGKLKDIRGYIH